MQVHEIAASRGSRKKKRRVGRGRGSGSGKTSGRGQTGQKSRAGRGILGSLEGGQMPLIRRLPKVGFRSRRPVLYQVVHVGDLSRFKAGTVVGAQALKDKGLIKSMFRPFKVLGDGDVKQGLTVQAYSFSQVARKKIEKAGGTIETFTRKDIKKLVSSNDQK